MRRGPSTNITIRPHFFWTYKKIVNYKMHVILCLVFISLIICKTTKYRIYFDILNMSPEIIMFEFLKKKIVSL